MPGFAQREITQEQAPGVTQDRAVSSGVEHDIHTVGVGGSKPSPPTIKDNARRRAAP